MKAYISKFALDEGIAEVEDFSISDDGTTLTLSEDDVTYEFGVGQWHMTREDAVMAANILRNDLIKVYQMKLDRLQRINIC